jgi:hypothetical protein
MFLKPNFFIKKTLPMALLIANLVNETMTPAQIAQFQKGIQMAFDALPKKPILSNADYAQMPKIGPARRKWANQIVPLMPLFPEYVPSALKVADVQNDNTLNNQLSNLHEQHLSKVVDLMTLLRGISGGEEWNAVNRFVDNVRTGVKNGEPNAIDALNQIENVDETP